jgi:hypothetical protein
MLRFNSKKIFTLYMYAVIAIVSVLIGGIDYSNARCGTSCSDWMTNNLSLLDVSPPSSHITGDCCCSLNKSLCAANSSSMTCIFNVKTVKKPISRHNQHQSYYLICGNNPALFMHKQVYRDNFRHFFIKKYPLYLQYSILIC